MEDRIVGRLVVSAAKGVPVSLMGDELYFWLDESLSCCISDTDLLADGDSVARITDVNTGDVLKVILGDRLKKELLEHINF